MIQTNSAVALELARRAGAAATHREGTTQADPPWSQDYGQAAVDLDLGDGRLARIVVTVTGDEPDA